MGIGVFVITVAIAAYGAVSLFGGSPFGSAVGKLRISAAAVVITALLLAIATVELQVHFGVGFMIGVLAVWSAIAAGPVLLIDLLRHFLSQRRNLDVRSPSIVRFNLAVLVVIVAQWAAFHALR